MMKKNLINMKFIKNTLKKYGLRIIYSIFIILLTLSQLKAQTCGTTVKKLYANGTTTANGVTITTSSTGSAGSYVDITGASTVQTMQRCGIISTYFIQGLLTLGKNGSFSTTFNFDKPVNDVVVMTTHMGLDSYLTQGNEYLYFNSNGGTVSITTLFGCDAYVSGNTIYGGAAPHTSTNSSGGDFRIHAPTPYTSLTVYGPGGLNGTTFGLCATSIIPQTPPAITSITPSTQTICKNATQGPITVSATGTGPLNYQWYHNTTNSTVGGTLIPGATSANYTPPTTYVIGTNYYYVVVTNANGSATSSVVNVIINDCVCYKPGATTGGETLNTKMGITSLNRAGAKGDNWPMIRKGGWLALESKTKGFVPNRISFDNSGNPVGILPANFIEGMMVYDTTNQCLKIFTSTDNGTTFSWKCVNKQTCPY